MNLDGWRDIADPTTRVIACLGDSTTEKGWAKILRDVATNRWGYGGYGVVHPGKYRPADANGNLAEQWTQAGSWTHGTNTDLWNIGFGSGGTSALCGTWHASGSGNTMTWTKPSDCPAVTGFNLLVCDGTGSANFSVSIDGGAQTNVSTSWVQGNAIKKITINTAVASTVAVRAANAAGTAVDLYVVGIEPLCATTGVKVHDLGCSGSFSNQLIRDAGVADWKQWLNLEQPQLVFCMFINDATFWTGSLPADYSTRLQELAQTVTGYGGVCVIYSYFQWGDGSAPTYATETDKTARELAAAQQYGGGYYYDLNALNGGSHASQLAAGIFDTDGAHPSPKGSRLMANHAWNVAGRVLYPKLSTR